MTDAMFFTITIPSALIVLNVALYLWNPKVKWKPLHGKNGENSLFHIAMDPDARYARAVLAQEIAERRWKIARGFGIPGLQLILQRIPAMNRAMELWGHEVEVQAAALIYGADEDGHRGSEAWAMSQNSSYGFYDADWSTDTIISKMSKRSRKARKWVHSNVKLLEKG